MDTLTCLIKCVFLRYIFFFFFVFFFFFFFCYIKYGNGDLFGEAILFRRLKELPTHYILEESNFNFRNVRLCDLDIPRENG